MGIPEKIRTIQDEIEKTQINKATEHHVGLLKAKIARLRRELEENTHARVLSTGNRNSGFDTRKAGDATVVLVGLPSVGKSTLLNRITNAKSRVGSYNFTTLTAIPGILEHLGAKIQILDMPGIIEGASKGKGFGKRVLSIARNADLVLLILDVFQPQNLTMLKSELSNIGIKLDQNPPDVLIEKATTGGVSVNMQVQTKITETLVKDICRINGIHNGRVIIREPGLTDEQFIDVLSGNRVYIPSIAVLNKIDLVNQGFVREVQAKIGDKFIPISADANMNIDALRDAIYNKLDFIRVYMKPKGGRTDYDGPLIMRRGCTVQDVCNKIHRSIVREFRFSLIWGKSAKFGGQKVGLDHTLIDEDVLTIIKNSNAT